MYEWLRHTLREHRQQAGATLQAVETAGAGVDRSQLSRFENGEQGWPKNPDRIVDAYAAACGVTPYELWKAALELWAEDPDHEIPTRSERAKQKVRQRRSR